MRFLLAAGLLCWILPVSAQTVAAGASGDTDQDGLSDTVESALLAQFAPVFMASDDDCSLRPAEFVPLRATPEVQNENGTIYGQAFPRQSHDGQVELHYYHLWRRDCGEMSHVLDVEHVSALVVRGDASSWKALYWYAAAHEDTPCDASQITRAGRVAGEFHGPEVWISRGKHASFLSPAICARGCGGDSCGVMKPLTSPKLINVGERSRAMNGAIWADSPQWPLAEKMSRSDFTETRTARADRGTDAGIAWANPEKRPMQAAILGGNNARGGASVGLHAADTALDTASSDTGNALNSASESTESGLAKTARSVRKALRATARKLGLKQ